MKKHGLKNKLIAVCLLVCVLFGTTAGCERIEPKKQTSPSTPQGELNQNALTGDTAAAGYSRDLSKVDFSGVALTPWDTAKAAKGLTARNTKPYTLLIYMNGSDLESEYGAATNDLVEMLKSGLKPAAANLIIFTGGTNRWRNNVVSASDCTLWEIADGAIGKIADVGLRSMGDAGTLSSFIDFGVKYFPAEKYGLILWDHGGGSIAGYGHDEKFADGTLSLLKLNYAFEKSAAKQKPFEFIGFDACLMASVETAVVAAPYAKYFIASEDLEPGDGWDYGFLAALNGSPAVDGAALGKAIVDSFMDFYGADYDEGLSLSVVNLKGAGGVMAAAGALTAVCSDNLAAQKRASFNTLSKKRSNTKTFGEGSPRDNESDMVDVGDMSEKLKDLFPAEAGAVRAALDKCVAYNRHNSDVGLCGLSAYYLYGGKKTADKSLSIYSALKVESNYSAYLHNFSDYLKSPFTIGVRSADKSGNASADDTLYTDLTVWQPLKGHGDAEGQGTCPRDTYVMVGVKHNIGPAGEFEKAAAPKNNMLWPRINGVHVCIYRINGGKGHETFAVPVSFNGENADIIIAVSGKNPKGRILGVRKEEGFIVQKGCDPVKDGDKISFYFEQRNFGGKDAFEETAETKWHKSKEFTVKGGLTLDWAKHGAGGAYCCAARTDTQNNKHYGVIRKMMTLFIKT